MKLSRKTFLYASGFVALLLIFIVGYFIMLLPSLYVDYIQKNNFDKIVSVQRKFIKDRSYDAISVKNPTNTFSFIIPDKGDEIMVYNKLISFNLIINDQKIKQTLNSIRTYVKDFKDSEAEHIERKKPNIDGNYILELIKKLAISDNESPIKLLNINTKNTEPMKEISTRYKLASKNIVVSQWDGTDGAYYYTNYVTFSMVDDDMFISFFTTMTPNMEELQPIVLQSLPMIVVVTVLLVLLLTRRLTRKIVTPIEKLAYHAGYVRQSGILEEEREISTGTDEIAILSQSLNQLYRELNENYQELENTNQILREQNVRQEVFLRSSSHQLKTPITAALLLMDGIIHKVGRYSDCDTYLPEVKGQILSMKKIVDDILYLRRCEDERKIEKLNLEQIISLVLEQFDIQMNEKALSVRKVCSSTDKTSNVFNEKTIYEIYGNYEMVKKIFENIISNAVNYSDANSEIIIRYKKNAIYISNQCDGIDKEILPTVFEPFVTSNLTEKGHGLGLYVVQYYCKLLGYVVNIYNIDNGVETVIEFV